ncbi:hypothetical protein SELMODRAFT_270651 [Selaginella moellendorffii]|uniref:ACB domain-containing protein n=1 Tax=Selaginella moellendorffii TaxID=88036 RepID=D8R9W9_SELML|nr:acyl-CoA-binding protein [Selaginella moellendorffii]XP_002981729.1 acyl-CoA-binding protein [Selaginella moellendorffii]XP_024528278.1 acyl-CoA-binding protein [Selaginella moellendorffii]EFJ17211.1 hypothetical protein SELMODRAFT_228774 [Selaginella moellendorffii]EFJ30963.1 hypothetical protein SELMODRAFT_270651 [Selaginella moellendorffii]|eukprot:XP_002967616.1 acyl-CoA-binding protein [Selaginella moellendorffii]
MATTEEQFKKAAEDALKLPPTTTDADKLILYGLYKQATVGNNETSRPGMLDFKGKAKWDAWKKCEGKSADDAMKDYIAKVEQLMEATA